MDINRLLKDICIRHAKKHIDSYVRDLEQALNIKINLGSNKYEYVYNAQFEFCSDARNKEKRILKFEQQQIIFSVECNRCFNMLHVKFKFHPENVL